MPSTFKKVQALSILLLLVTLFSCSKSINETAAGKAAGVYKGVVSMVVENKTLPSQYNDYIVKIEPSSSQKVIVSCISQPKVFDNFEVTVAMDNKTIASNNSRKQNLFYVVSASQLQLNVACTAATAMFTGFRQK